MAARTPARRQAAFRLRYEVYVAEQGKPYPEADHELRELTDDLDPSAEIILVEVCGEAVGTLRANWFDSRATQSSYPDALAFAQAGNVDLTKIVACSRLAILPDHRNSRVRRLLFETIYQLALQRGTKLCFATCAPALLPLFTSYGFREYAPPGDDPVVGALCRVLLILDDVEYLAEVGSPFLAIARRASARSHHPIAPSSVFAGWRNPSVLK